MRGKGYRRKKGRVKRKLNSSEAVDILFSKLPKGEKRQKKGKCSTIIKLKKERVKKRKKKKRGEFVHC